MPFWNLSTIPSKMKRCAALDLRSLTGTAACCAMLQAMQPAASTQSSSDVSDFAGLLASLTAPSPNAAEDESLWSSSDLGEDAVSLSYERALRAHARYRPEDRNVQRNDASLLSSGQSGTGAASSALSAMAPERDLRTASVTIRLSKAESAQLHQRAREAGLTVSAYLRSCALEAEELRAQVKQALAELKTGNEGTAMRENKQPGNCARDGAKLTRVLGHIGSLCRRLSTKQSS